MGMTEQLNTNGTRSPLLLWLTFVLFSISATLFCRTVYDLLLSEIIPEVSGPSAVVWVASNPYNWNDAAAVKEQSTEAPAHADGLRYSELTWGGAASLALSLALCISAIIQLLTTMRWLSLLHEKALLVKNKFGKFFGAKLLFVPTLLVFAGCTQVVFPGWFGSGTLRVSFHLITFQLAFAITGLVAGPVMKAGWERSAWAILVLLLTSYLAIYQIPSTDFLSSTPWTIAVIILLNLVALLRLRRSCVNIPDALSHFFVGNNNRPNDSASASAYKMIYFVLFLAAASGMLIDAFKPFTDQLASAASSLFGKDGLGLNQAVTVTAIIAFDIAFVFHVVRLYMSLELLEYAGSSYGERVEKIPVCWARVGEFSLRGAIIVVISLKLLGFFRVSELAGLGLFMVALYLVLLLWDVWVRIFSTDGSFETRLFVPSLAGLTCGIVILISGLRPKGNEDFLQIVSFACAAYFALIAIYVVGDKSTFGEFCRYISGELAHACGKKNTAAVGASGTSNQ